MIKAIRDIIRPKGLYHDATAPDEAKRIQLRKKRKKKSK